MPKFPIYFDGEFGTDIRQRVSEEGITYIPYFISRTKSIQSCSALIRSSGNTMIRLLISLSTIPKVIPSREGLRK
jgi:hypothetical protein